MFKRGKNRHVLVARSSFTHGYIYIYIIYMTAKCYRKLNLKRIFNKLNIFLLKEREASEQPTLKY